MPRQRPPLAATPVVCLWSETDISASTLKWRNPVTSRFSGREGGIRTRDLSVPNAAR